MYRYNGVEGLHTKVTEFVKDKDCLVCGPGVLVELETSVTLEKVSFFYLLLIAFESDGIKLLPFAYSLT